eukprot:EG_transcript_19367
MSLLPLLALRRVLLRAVVTSKSQAQLCWWCNGYKSRHLHYIPKGVSSARSASLCLSLSECTPTVMWAPPASPNISPFPVLFHSLVRRGCCDWHPGSKDACKGARSWVGSPPASLK